MVTNPKLCFWGLLLTGELSLHKLGDWSEEIDDEPMEDGASLTSAGSGRTMADLIEDLEDKAGEAVDEGVKEPDPCHRLGLYQLRPCTQLALHFACCT